MLIPDTGLATNAAACALRSYGKIPQKTAVLGCSTVHTVFFLLSKGSRRGHSTGAKRAPAGMKQGYQAVPLQGLWFRANKCASSSMGSDIVAYSRRSVLYCSTIHEQNPPSSASGIMASWG